MLTSWWDDAKEWAYWWGSVWGVWDSVVTLINYLVGVRAAFRAQEGACPTGTGVLARILLAPSYLLNKMSLLPATRGREPEAQHLATRRPRPRCGIGTSRGGTRGQCQMMHKAGQAHQTKRQRDIMQMGTRKFLSAGAYIDPCI